MLFKISCKWGTACEDRACSDYECTEASAHKVLKKNEYKFCK